MAREIALSTTVRGEFKKQIAGWIVYLGTDQIKALQIAKAALDKWDALRATGATTWTDTAKREVLDYKALILSDTTPAPPAPLPATFLPQAVPPPAPAPAPVVPVADSSLTFHGLLRRMDQDNQQRVPAEITQRWCLEQRYRMARLKRDIKDVPLSAMTADWVRDVVRAYGRRPHNKSGEPIAVDTVVNQVACLRLVLTFADEHNLWVAPSRFGKLFRINRKSLMTDDERGARGEFTLYSIPDLAKLYAVADDERKGWILCGLNFAFANAELATFMVKEINFETGIVRRVRRKTGVIGTWRAWPQTLAILKKMCAGKNPTDRVFTRSDGQPLCTLARCGAKVDRVPETWRVLNRLAKVKNLGFKTLRKQAAQMVRDIAGKDQSELMLSHVCHDVSIHYTRESSDRLFSALDVMHQKLQPLFDAAEAKSVQGKAAPVSPEAVAA